MMKKRFYAGAVIILLLTLITGGVYAAPYSNYTFNHLGEYYYEPQGMIPDDYFDWSKMIDGNKDEATLRKTPLKDPTDMFIRKTDGVVAISDTGNARIIILDKNFKLLSIIKNFDVHYTDANGVLQVDTKAAKTFDTPAGIYMDNNNNLYVTDRGTGAVDGRVLRFKVGADGKAVCDLQYPTPDMSLLKLARVAAATVSDDQNGGAATSTPEPTASESASPEATATDSGNSAEATDAIPIFQPQHILCDKTGRIYVMSKDIYQGILQYDRNGKFNQVIAAPKVANVYSGLDYVLKKFASEQQKQRDYQQVPPEYSSMDIDSDGFIYATIAQMPKAEIVRQIAMGREATDQGAPVRKVNPEGKDILRRKGSFAPVGDVIVNPGGNYAEEPYSKLVDVVVYPNSLYSVLDSKRCKVFTYDQDGNLVYIFGVKGKVLGAFQNPVSIDYLPQLNNSKESKVAVLDAAIGQITVFKPTAYSQLIIDANTLQNNLKFTEANAKWNELIKLSSNSELGYIGKGRYEYEKGHYKQAMDYFKLGNDPFNYSKALEQYRKGILSIWTPWIMSVILLGLLAMMVNAGVKRYKNMGKEDKIK